MAQKLGYIDIEALVGIIVAASQLATSNTYLFQVAYVFK